MECEIFKRNLKERSPLLHYAKNITSQGGEDGILETLFHYLFSNGDRNDKKFLVDIGAWDGIHLSNSRSLLKDDSNYEWGGILIEADSSRCELLKKLYEH